MKRKIVLTLVTTLALVAVWVPTAEAGAKWSFGNGQSDLAVEQAPGQFGGVCTTHIEGRAGSGTSLDPAVTPPPDPPTSGYTVELYAGADLGQGTHAPGSGRLTFPADTGIPDLLPLAVTTTAAPIAIVPPEEYTGFDVDDKIWEYAEAEFEFELPASGPGSLPAGSQVVIAKSTNAAYVQQSATSCTTTTVSSSADPSAVGENVTFTATVLKEDGQPVTEQNVEFVIDGTVVGSAPVAANGQASFSISSLSAGSHEVVANYVGAPFSFLTPSSGAVTQNVGAADNTAPTFGPCTGGPFLLNSGSQPVSIAAADEPGGSGVDTAASTLSGSVGTSSVGGQTVVFTATDNEGNSATEACTYQVNYVLNGFFFPVDNDRVNLAKAGWTVPFKFTVKDANGVPVKTLRSAVGSSSAYTCDAADPTDALEYYAFGSSGLKNLGHGWYRFNFKTYPGWKSSCRTLSIQLNDGVSHSADFQFNW